METFGSALRRLRGPMSLRELAARAHCGKSYVADLEQGRRHPSRDMALALDRALDAEGRLAALARPTAEWGPKRDSPADVLEASGAPIEALRKVLDAHDLPSSGDVRPLRELSAAVRQVVWLRLQARYGTLGQVLPALIVELQEAFRRHDGQRRRQVAGMLVQSYRAADAIADKLGLVDLSARIIGMMTTMALESGDETLIATTAYVRSELFFASGAHDDGRRMLVRAADRLDPGAGVAACAAYGSLHMRAAVFAARDANLADARLHACEALDIARTVPESVYLGTLFGLSTVRIHQITIAVDSKDPDGALRIAEQWRPGDDVPAERRSHYFVDIARAWADTGKPDQALGSLVEARAIAPEHIRPHPDVGRLLATTVMEPLRRDPRWRELNSWMRGPAKVS
ncbi:helix-turn-helix transcriptional regulator [Frankia sp. AgB1.9]|uniref:helix-turn-helix domain-containing protein n=1 Tax=unclassified Frankia TaxID=2632575 RepID=UPI001931FFB4|nr:MULTISPECIES: helix-turn-helix transcriptional regulator [unclassified Frankia]MBL7487882.1 helix-turn-helix transcriptional regulator [Frankia sp. AgW1.1]MBL7549947.1 helix-turn-helix transcriptional regulator [Frankia sp. AgB1.9]MBL7621474.1 helix-turn-helix transcriptional regulator [Frankia sp. AgB1.8]